MADLTDINGVGPSIADAMRERGYESVDDVAEADPDELAQIDGVSDDRALEFVVQAGNLRDDEAPEPDDTVEGPSPGELSEDVDEGDAETDDDESTVEVEADQTAEESVSEEQAEEFEEPYPVTVEINDSDEYDALYAAILRGYERNKDSSEPAANALQNFLDELRTVPGEGELNVELTGDELNEIHSALVQQRTGYQGQNLIDLMDALRRVENRVNDQREKYLF